MITFLIRWSFSTISVAISTSTIWTIVLACTRIHAYYSTYAQKIDVITWIVNPKFLHVCVCVCVCVYHSNGIDVILGIEPERSFWVAAVSRLASSIKLWVIWLGGGFGGFLSAVGLMTSFTASSCSTKSSSSRTPGAAPHEREQLRSLILVGSITAKIDKIMKCVPKTEVGCGKPLKWHRMSVKESQITVKFIFCLTACSVSECVIKLNGLYGTRTSGSM